MHQNQQESFDRLKKKKGFLEPTSHILEFNSFTMEPGHCLFLKALYAILKCSQSCKPLAYSTAKQYLGAWWNMYAINSKNAIYTIKYKYKLSHKSNDGCFLVKTKVYQRQKYISIIR